MKIRALICGCPGSGKGTISSKITRYYKGQLVTISSGDLLRSQVNLKTPLGIQAEQILDSGDLVPDSLMLQVMSSEWQKIKHVHWMLDGFPRTLKQAEALDEFLKDEEPLNLVLNLDVPSSVILERIKNRWIHAPSGRVYNLSYNPPKISGLDDITGEPLSKRKDDDLIIAKKRLEKYHSETFPLLNFYSKRGFLENLKGSSSDDLFPKLIKILDTFLKEPATFKTLHVAKT